jgi:NAD(P)H-hydrate epimerase
MNASAQHPAPDAADARVAGHRVGVWPLVGAAEMQALDRETIEGRGLAGEILMESAGRACVAPALSLRASAARPAGPIVVLCATGNNGGDGFVLARHLAAEGVAAHVILLGDPERLPSDADANWRRLERFDVSREVLDPGDADLDWAELLAGASVAVDALFGTGLQRDVGGGFARLVAAIEAARGEGVRVLSIDMPSGIEASTGRVLGVAVRADRTVTIALPKIGLALEPGRSHAGRIDVARIGIVDPDPERSARVELWTPTAVAPRLPARARAGHKGDFGHVLVVAGSRDLAGAAALCSRACVRAGAGLVTLALPSGVAARMAGRCAEVMTTDVAATPEGAFARAGEKPIAELAAARDVVAIGPGLSRDDETVDLVRRLVVSIDRPMVIDADGLFALVGRLELLEERGAATVLTPHPGEAARLLETSASTLNEDRIGAARRLAARSGAVVLLKGAGSVVAEPSGRALVVPTGGPVLATGGTGDVLTGVVAALLAAGRDPFEAAGLAAWWHGATADRLDPSGSGFGVLASELADALPEAAADLVARTGGAVPGEADGALVLPFPGR